MHTLSQLEKIGFFDLETTGLDVRTVRVVTASVGLLNRSGAVLSSINWLISPGVEIPEAAARVHGVTNEMAEKSGQDPTSAISEIVAALNEIFEQQVPVVAFNAAYDFSIISAEAIRHRVSPVIASPVFDPLIIDRKVNKYRSGKRTLVDLARHYEIPLLNAHTAEADAVAAARLALKQLDLYKQISELSADALHAQQMMWADEQAADFEAYMQQRSPLFRAERGWPVRRELS